ncbi:MAG TPA: AfsA-related hotdog domain-containing protein [Terriglobales bacterium]|nr:AfsA-related hotdog domain-containing protein [Terriglobales bacterium]
MAQERIDGRYVHKVVPRNVLLARVERRVGEGECYEAEMVMDTDHPFFFEHPLDHIPAMMLVEAGRQMGIAISHMFLDVPFGYLFATQGFDIHFTEFAELHEPVVITSSVSDKKFRRAMMVGLKLEGRFAQGARQLGRMTGEFAMMPPELWRRYRRRQMLRVEP